jgi:catechol 2,3-dioxygenase-like lactoylglutathione lyase family enzyme
MLHSISAVGRLTLLPLLALLGGSAPAGGRHPVDPGAVPATLRTVAYRVHRMPAMVAFYTEAFGARFAEVNANGIRSQFGVVGPLTLKFVPIRDTVDFDGFPVHQLGFEVADVGSVIRIAQRHGGRVQDPPRPDGGRMHAALRDPDGNTLEVYGPRQP